MENYIREVSSIADGLVEITVVVNSDPGGQADSLAESLRQQGITCFSIVSYGDNVGYLNAMLKTVQQTDLGRYDYFMLSNTDIHYETRDFFQQLLSREYPRDVGCIAPSVYNPNSRSYSNPHYMERVPEEKLRRLVRIFGVPTLGRLYLTLAGLKAGRAKKGKKPSCYVYSPHGCCMIFTREFIGKICGYEYGVKLYSEESAIGEQLRKSGLKCYYDDSIEVVHNESSVTGKMDYRKRFAAWRASLEYILDEFYG